MTKKQIEEQLRKLVAESGVDVGKLRRILGKAVVEYEQEVGWPQEDKGKPRTDAELGVVLSDAATKGDGVKHAKAVGRGYNRQAVTALRSGNTRQSEAVIVGMRFVA